MLCKQNDIDGKFRWKKIEWFVWQVSEEKQKEPKHRMIDCQQRYPKVWVTYQGHTIQVDAEIYLETFRSEITRFNSY